MDTVTAVKHLRWKSESKTFTIETHRSIGVDNTKYWFYIPSFVINGGALFADFMKSMPKLGGETKRKSCIFADHTSDDTDSSYSLPTYAWQDHEIINALKTNLESVLHQHFDYCLFHLYPNGNSSIGYHRDQEADDTIVVSLSFGATRKFRFRRPGQTQGYDVEYQLRSGDLLVMQPDCQKMYLHSVPIEASVKQPRINLTFRQRVVNPSP